MSPMVLFEAVSGKGCGGFWKVPLLPLKGSGGPFLVAHLSALWGGFGDPDGLEGPWERSWEALLEALGKAHLQRPQKNAKHRQRKWITFWGSNIATL